MRRSGDSEMTLPLFSACFAALSVTFYVLLDGFDLGVGALLLLQPDERSRDHMVDSITPTWDGNETWLIMTGVTLLAAFPIAYGILMPALYIPVIVMLLALGLRGVSFEFRAQAHQYRQKWDVVFALGSIVAASMQGLILGALLEGVSVEGIAFSGSVLDCFGPFPLLCAVCVLAGYVLLGGCWLQFKATARLQRFAERTLKFALPLFVAAFIAAAAISISIQPGILVAWQTHTILLVTLSGIMIVAALILFAGIGKHPDAQPFAASLTIVAAGIVGLVVLMFPDIVPFRVSLWDAAASRLSQVFLLTGAVLVSPVVLGYSFFAYWVFRGKTPEKGWDE
jgi:cytochrome bd ubiquinol oxidase subunit II